MKKNSLGIIFLAGLVFSSCQRTETIQSISEIELFTLPYGKFEEQLSTADLNSIGNIQFGIEMRDGFFYLVDGDAKKIMEINSYGDLLTLFYNEDAEIADFFAESKRMDKSIHHEISYPFDYPGKIAVDSKKYIYAVCSIPVIVRKKVMMTQCFTAILSFDLPETVLLLNTWDNRGREEHLSHI